MWLQKALPTFDEPFIICFDLKDHRLSNLLEFQYHCDGIFNSFAAYDTYLTEWGLLKHDKGYIAFMCLCPGTCVNHFFMQDYVLRSD